MRRLALLIALSMPVSARAQGECPTNPVPACSPGDGHESADGLYAAVVEASNRIAQASPASHPQRPRGRRGRRGPEEPLAPLELDETRRAFVEAGTRFLCRFPGHPEAVTVSYRIARIFYEANHFADAAPRFHAIATNHHSHELASYAASLYLDSLNVMATRVPEPQAACVTALRASIEPLRARFCATPDRVEAHPDLCEVLTYVRCDAQQAEAEGLSRAGRHREAGDAYARMARERVCGRGDERLFNAGVEYDAAHLVPRAIEVWTTLTQHFPASVLALRARARIGARLHATAQYREAADQYVELARRYPGASRDGCADAEIERGLCPDARELLREAVLLYAALGDRDAAQEAASLHQRNYGRDRERAAEVGLVLPRMLSEAEEWPAARRAWATWVRMYASRARPEQAVEARVALGRAHGALGEHEQAQAQYAEVIRRWAGGALLDELDAPDEHAAAVRSAVAEATFRRTDERAMRLLASSRPTAAELAAIAFDLGGVAALAVPAWSIAASARLAALELHLAEAPRGAPGVGLTARALEHAEACAQLAIQARWPSDEARGCLELQSRLAPDRLRPLDELVPSRMVSPSDGVEPPAADPDADARLVTDPTASRDGTPRAPP